MGVTPEGRLLIVSHRLPVTLRRGGADLVVVPSAGGVATGLAGPHEASDGLWFGYPGELGGLVEPERADVEAELARRRLVPVPLEAARHRAYYEGFSNQILWPLFHYLLERVPLNTYDWDDYCAVNARFADSVAAHYRPGDRIWVHDYQLLLLPGLLRQRLPDARIGFFLHIPFPSSEVFRTLPWRNRLLEGLLGADLVGFHSYPYLQHFTHALLDVLGLESEVDRVRLPTHTVRLGVFPMGVDARHLDRLSCERGVMRRVAGIRHEAIGRRILLGIDRLDYTKGILRRLLAFERLLEESPEQRGRLRLIQVAVPSREEIPDYQAHRGEVEAMVGRINGTYGSVDAAPIHYLHQSLSPQELVALYRAAHVMLVTPMRDGMNLVAKEFVAARSDDEGVLVLSEFAGAASELGEAVAVNPYDIEGLVAVLRQALEMPLSERRARMRALRRRVQAFDVHHWAETFLRALAAARTDGGVAPRPWSGPELLRSVVTRLRRARSAILLLDYDGTLVPHTPRPEEAHPDADVVTLLEELTRQPGLSVHIVSGRAHTTLETWLGGLDAALWAEHGYWRRQRPGQPWKAQFPVPPGWDEKIRPVLEEFAARTPGAQVECKTASLTWHYRGADAELGPLQARRLRAYLAEALHNLPVEVLPGRSAVEIRLHGISKGRVASRLPLPEPGRVEILAIGDDQSDEDLFAALPQGSLAMHVGTSDSLAEHRLPDVAAVRRLLGALALCG